MPLAARSPRSERDGKEQKDALRGEMQAVRTTEHGMREYIINKQSFVLPNRYQPTQKLGSGSYGIVVAAEDNENGEKMAIKRCGNVFKHCEDGKRVLREIKMMSMLDHRNILPVRDIFVTSTNFEDVYVVTPCLNTDLAKLIKSYRLSEQHVKYIMYQILRGLKYVHTANILHRDLKPANVLVNYDCHVKLCDFGLARGYDPHQKVEMTSYIVTRWYRAPELLLQNTNYGPAVDIWAAGCIFAEMLIGKPLFQGNSSIEQLQLICASTAIPDTKDLWWVQSPKMRQYLNQTRVEREGIAPKDLKYLLSGANVAPAHHPGLVSPLNPQALDMLQKMLAFSPYQRWSAEYLLDHPYLSEMKSGRHHEPASHKFKWKYDCVRNLQKPELRKLFWQELVRFQPDCKFAPPGTHPGTPVAIKVLGSRQENVQDENATIKQPSVQTTRSVA